MDALKAVGLCALLTGFPKEVLPCGQVVKITSPAMDRWQSQIAAASLRFGLPAEWIAAAMARESAGLTMRDGHLIVSSAGAMGLMQLMPATWSELRLRYGLGPDPFDPHDNIFAGAAYLREMFDRYGYPGLFAAYHAGPGGLDAVLAGRISLPAATKTYLESIVPDADLGSVSGENRNANAPKSGPNVLFFVRADDKNHPPPPPIRRLTTHTLRMTRRACSCRLLRSGLRPLPRDFRESSGFGHFRERDRRKARLKRRRRLDWRKRPSAHLNS